MIIKTLFLGSNYEALETLKTLDEDPHFEIVGVITQPDKPVGRKQEIVPTDIKKYCLEKNIKVFYTNNDVKKYKNALDFSKPDLTVCKSFGEIIPEFFLEYPKYGAINVHFSLLPKYRGAVPIQAAILNGDEETGISIIKMVGDLDGGPILAQYVEKILPNDTNGSLRKRLVEKTTAVLPNVLMQWVGGDITPKEQNESEATYCYKEDISKEKAEMKFDEQTSIDIDRIVRALIPWPIAWMRVNGKKVKVFSVEISSEYDLKPKEFLVKDGELIIGCKEGAVKIKRVQMEGKKEMDVKEFLNGLNVASIQ
jgi:methionyl-tRNA formyltransferase